MTPEQLSFAMERLFEVGALDVFFTSIYMKKNRPGVLLSVLCKPEKKAAVVATMLKETSTFGVRYSRLDREILDREFIQLDTEFGTISCKLGSLDGVAVKAVPEYEDCRKAAHNHGKSLIEVYNAAVAAASQIKQ